MKSVLTSIQPYYVFLIIARLMGWNIPQEKTVEVRKNFPKDPDWNKVDHIYCSKNKKSFNRIPKQYQPFMAKLLGKVIGEFVCDEFEEFHEWQLSPQGQFQEFEEKDLKRFLSESCLSWEEVYAYRQNLPYYKPLFGWHISDLKIYDTPKELGEFVNCNKDCKSCEDRWLSNSYAIPTYVCLRGKYMTRPPQSWCYCDSL